MDKRWETIEMKNEKRPRWNREGLPKNEILMAISGASGSGKSTHLLKIIPNISCMNGVFSKYVVVCSLIIGNPIYQTIQKYCEKTDRIYKFTSEVNEAMDILEEVINSKKNNEHIILILDDFNDSSQNGKYTKFTNNAFTKLRNYGCQLIFIIQRFSSIPTITRSNLNMLICYNVSDKYSKKFIATQMRSMVDVPEIVTEKLFIDISKYKYSYFFCDTDGDLYIYINNGNMKTPQRVDYSDF